MRYSRMLRNVRLGLENLLLHKMRSLLTMLGVVFGVGSVIAMLSVGEGASREALEQIRRLGSDIILLTSSKPVEEANATQSRHNMLSVYGLLYDDNARIRSTIGAVKQTVPVKLFRKEGRVGTRAMEVRVVGTTPAWFELVRRDMIAGRTLRPADVDARGAVAVLTEHGARRLLAVNNTTGKDVKIGDAIWKVVGIVKSESANAGGIATPDADIDAYMPIDVSRERYGDLSMRVMSGSFERELVELHQIIVQVDRMENVEATAEALRRMLERFHEKIDYEIKVPLTLLRQAEQTKRTFNIVLGSIACISLLVGGIGIMNIMLASVTERTPEIGIRRAIGAKKRQIVGQFLTETVVLSTIGGLIGIGFGFAIPWLITLVSGMPTIVTPASVIVSLVISVGIGIIFGMYPAVRAANLDPITALRHE